MILQILKEVLRVNVPISECWTGEICCDTPRERKMDDKSDYV